MAICGPVEGENLSNGPDLPEQGPTGWRANAHEHVEVVLGAVIRRCVLVNDFVAVGFGLTVVDDSDVVTLHSAPVESGGVIGCVGAGTGLGEVFLTSRMTDTGAHEYTAHSSEGGMCEFHAHCETEWLFRRWLLDHRTHATVEGLVSGPGLANAYEFLVDRQANAEAARAADPVLSLPREEQPATIASRMTQGDELAMEAVDVVWISFSFVFSLPFSPQKKSDVWMI